MCKTVLGVKRRPNRKDRIRARAKLGVAGGEGELSPPDPKLADTARLKQQKLQKQQRQLFRSKNGKTGMASPGAGSKRKGRDGSPAAERPTKQHKAHVVPEKAKPAVRPLPAQVIPKTEKGQMLQALLRKKLAKTKAFSAGAQHHSPGAATAAAAEHVSDCAGAQKQAFVAAAHAGLPEASGAQASADRNRSTSKEEAGKDASVTVVQGKVATGKVSSNWQALKKDLKRERRLEKKGGKKPAGESSSSAAAKSKASAGALLPSQLELINCRCEVG